MMFVISQLWLDSGERILTNNSYIYYANISHGYNALKCVTDNPNCCTDVNWNDETGTVVSTARVIAFQTHQDCGDVI